MNFVFPAPWTKLVDQLPVAPPSRVFSMRANRLLWPVLKTLDCQQLVGGHYAVRVEYLGLNLRFTVTQHGFEPDSGAPDLTITATAGDFLLRLIRRENPDTLPFSRRLGSEGDTEIGLTIKNLPDALDPESVLHHLPKPLAHAAQRLIRP